MLNLSYILDEQHQPIPADITDSRWLEFWSDFDNRRVAQDQLGPANISTVFLSMDHGFGIGRPVLFETMIFWPDHEIDERCERYETWDDALAGHDAACTLVRGLLKAQR